MSDLLSLPEKGSTRLWRVTFGVPPNASALKSSISNLWNYILHKQSGQDPALSIERGKYIMVGLRCCAAAFLIFSLYLPNA